MSQLPGDLKASQLIDQMIRVDHAGEYGAKRIYQGQMSVLKSQQDQELLKHMADQEEEHLDYFTKTMLARRARPSILFPFWHIAGFALGAGTALLGKDAAMICTEAVEEVIDKHYQEQLQQLEDKPETELKEKIAQFRAEEIEHHDLALQHMKNRHLGHHLLYKAIKLGCKLSIGLAKRF